MCSYFRQILLSSLIVILLPYLKGQSLSLHEFEEEFIKIIDKVRSCVVKVVVTYKNRYGLRESSGIILDQQGHIVTVASAVKDSEKIQISLSSGEKISATLLGTDIQTNLAIIKIKPCQQLISVEKGDSDHLRVGAFLITIGNPYGLNNSVSTGIVSGLNRCAGIKGCERPLTGLIQTTAPINPGDDGGLVVDSKGKFVGMSFSTLNRDMFSSEQQAFFVKFFKFIKEVEKNDPEIKWELFFQNLPARQNYGASSGNALVSQGINFVIPSKTVYWVADQIISYGCVKRGWFGVTVKDADVGQGAMVIRVFPASPADQSGIQINDHLIELNGVPIPDSHSLLHQISYLSSGQIISLKLRRMDKEHTITVTLCTQFPKK